MTTFSLQSSPPSALRPPQLSLWLMILVLFIAALFRFFAINSAPPGWRDDELIEFGMDQRIVQGWRPLFITEAEGHEPVYHYIHAGTIALFGENIIGYKWLPFAFGLLTVALTYALARRMFDARVGLIAAALMAVSFWSIMYSRLGLRHIGLLPWMLGAFYLLYPAKGKWQGARSKWRIAFAGIFLAAGLMTYFAGRAVPIILIGFLIYLLLFNQSIFKRVWLPFTVAIVIGAIIALPMFIQIAQTPGSEKRTEVVGRPLIELTKGNLKPAIDTTLGTLGMFTFAGDPESLYNVSGRPVFDWISGAFFYLGVLLSLMRLKRVENGFALAWLVIGLAPAFVSLPAGSFSHTLAAQPIVQVLTAYGAIEVVSWVIDKMTRRQEDKTPALHPQRGAGVTSAKQVTLSSLYPFILSLIVVLGAGLTIRDYFGTWAQDDFVRFQYHAPTRDIAKWLDQNPDVVDVAIGTNPNELYLDPVALKLDLKRDDVRARWFNPDTTVVLPPHGFIVISPMQSANEVGRAFLESVQEYYQKIYRATGAIAFDVYGITKSYPQRSSPPDVERTFDNWAAFLGSTSSTQLQMSKIPIRSGDQFFEFLSWQIVQPSFRLPLKSFAHVLSSSNEIVSGSDLQDVSPIGLLTGDYFAQKVQITLPLGLKPGEYRIETGWYNPDTGERLKLPNGDDRYVLDQIEVTAP